MDTNGLNTALARLYGASPSGPLVEIGRGGQAVIFKANYLLDSGPKECVIKQALPGHEERVHKEGNMLASLHNPSVMSVECLGEDFFTMPYFARGTFSRYMARNKHCVTEKEIVGYLRQIVTALDYVSSKGIIHQDLKPANLLLNDLGNLVLSDFGVAEYVDKDGIYVSENIVGTPSYIPPEGVLTKQGVHELSLKTDQGIFGLVLYDLLLGKHPFIGEVNEHFFKGKNGQQVLLDLYRAAARAKAGEITPLRAKSYTCQEDDIKSRLTDLAWALSYAPDPKDRPSWEQVDERLSTLASLSRDEPLFPTKEEQEAVFSSSLPNIPLHGSAETLSAPNLPLNHYIRQGSIHTLDMPLSSLMPASRKPSHNDNATVNLKGK